MQYRKPLLLAVFLLIALFVSLNLNHLHAQDDEVPLVLEAGDYRLEINDLWLAGDADGKTPSHGKYLVMDIKLFNDSSTNVCFHDRDFTAKVPGLEDQTPEDLSEVRDEFFEGRDYPGGFLGQCLDAGESDLSLLEYDVPADVETLTLRFTPEDEEVEITLALPRRATKLGDGLIGLRLRVAEPGAEDSEASQAARQLASPTTAPSPTLLPSLTPIQKVTAAPRVASTLQATPTPRMTSTPQATSTPRHTPTTAIVTRYISATSNVNVRSCASTNCQIVMVLAPGSAINVLRSENGWYEITLADGQTGYVADFLATASRPVAPRPSAQQPAQADNNAAAPVQQDAAPVQPAAPPAPVQEQPISTPPPAPAFACDCSKTCPQMASCEEAYFQLSCGCGRRDADNDGVPCEEICPGG